MHKVHERAHASEIEDCLTHVSFHMYVVCTSADKYVTQFLSCVQMEYITFKLCVMHVCAFWENTDLKQQQQCCFRSNSIARRDIPTVPTYLCTCTTKAQLLLLALHQLLLLKTLLYQRKLRIYTLYSDNRPTLEQATPMGVCASFRA